MRLLASTLNDMRYQAKYGFYVLYTFMSALYIGVLLLLPIQHKTIGASLIILSDPAMLGFFFIGGIWLLEKGEGLHKFFVISPLRPVEYILAKTLSLAVISTLSALLIVLFALKTGPSIHYGMLLTAVFLGSCIATMAGLTIGTYARSVNHYMFISIPAELFIMLPAFLTTFGITNPVLNFFPGTMMWRMIILSLEPTQNNSFWVLLIGLIGWLGILMLVTLLRVSKALHTDGGEIT